MQRPSHTLLWELTWQIAQKIRPNEAAPSIPDQEVRDRAEQHHKKSKQIGVGKVGAAIDKPGAGQPDRDDQGSGADWEQYDTDGLWIQQVEPGGNESNGSGGRAGAQKRPSWPNGWQASHLESKEGEKGVLGEQVARLPVIDRKSPHHFVNNAFVFNCLIPSGGNDAAVLSITFSPIFIIFLI